LGKCYETNECVKILLMRDNATIDKLKRTHSDPFAVKGVADSDSLLKYYFDNKKHVIKKNTGPTVLKFANEHELMVLLL